MYVYKQPTNSFKNKMIIIIISINGTSVGWVSHGCFTTEIKSFWSFILTTFKYFLYLNKLINCVFFALNSLKSFMT